MIACPTCGSPDSRQPFGGAAPVIDADALNTAHNAYLSEVRRATTAYVKSRVTSLAIIADAQRAYAAWFAERGVTLTFPPEE